MELEVSWARSGCAVAVSEVVVKASGSTSINAFSSATPLLGKKSVFVHQVGSNYLEVGSLRHSCLLEFLSKLISELFGGSLSLTIITSKGSPVSF